jgi:hypothetical protein
MNGKRQLMAENWDSFARAVLPPNAPPVQITEMRRAFYAGAVGILHSILKVLEPGSEPTDADLKMMDGIQRELADFNEAVKAGRA